MQCKFLQLTKILKSVYYRINVNIRENSLKHLVLQHHLSKRQWKSYDQWKPYCVLKKQICFTIVHQCVKSVQIRSFFSSVFSHIQHQYRKTWTSKNSVFGHFSRSEQTINLLIHKISATNHSLSSHHSSYRHHHDSSLSSFLIDSTTFFTFLIVFTLLVKSFSPICARTISDSSRIDGLA